MSAYFSYLLNLLMDHQKLIDFMYPKQSFLLILYCQKLISSTYISSIFTKYFSALSNGKSSRLMQSMSIELPYGSWKGGIGKYSTKKKLKKIFSRFYWYPKYTNNYFVFSAGSLIFHQKMITDNSSNQENENPLN